MQSNFKFFVNAHARNIPPLNSKSLTIAFAGRHPDGSAGDSGALQHSALPSLSQRPRPPSFCWGLVGYWCCRGTPPYNIYMAYRNPGIWLLSFLHHCSSCTRRAVFACTGISAAAPPCQSLKRHPPSELQISPIIRRDRFVAAASVVARLRRIP